MITRRKVRLPPASYFQRSVAATKTRIGRSPAARVTTTCPIIGDRRIVAGLMRTRPSQNGGDGPHGSPFWDAYFLHIPRSGLSHCYLTAPLGLAAAPPDTILGHKRSRGFDSNKLGHLLCLLVSVKEPSLIQPKEYSGGLVNNTMEE